MFVAAVVAVLLGTAAAQPAPASAQPAPVEQPADDTTEVEGVNVVAPPDPATLEEKAYRHVRELAAPTRQDKLGRWNRPVCVLTTGAADRFNAYVSDRVTKAAKEAGVKVGRAGCEPNLFILLSGDSQADLRELEKKNPGFFLTKADGGNCEATSAGGQRITSGGATTLQTFLTTPRPVRWWHSAQSHPAGDQPWDGCRLRVFASRLSAPMREDFVRVFVAVDLKLANGAPLKAVADYAAMVSLAQIDPEADTTGLSTVLSLFRDRDAGRPLPKELTRWDKAYLKGLYRQRDNLSNESAQRRAILREITRTGATAPEAAGN